MPSRTSPPRTLRALLAGLLLALLAVGPALGHAELATSDPEAGSTLDTPPTSVTLTFTEGLDAGKSSFKVVGPAGTAATGTASGDGSKTMEADGLALGPGAYTVEWTAAAEDGHIERGTFAFTVNEPTPPPATAPPTETPAATAGTVASVAPTQAPVASAAASAAPSPGDTVSAAASGTDVLIPIIAALALVALVGVLVLRRNRAV